MIEAESHQVIFSTAFILIYFAFSLPGIVVCFCQGYDVCCHAELRSAEDYG